MVPILVRIVFVPARPAAISQWAPCRKIALRDRAARSYPVDRGSNPARASIAALHRVSSFLQRTQIPCSSCRPQLSDQIPAIRALPPPHARASPPTTPLKFPSEDPPAGPPRHRAPSLPKYRRL